MKKEKFISEITNSRTSLREKIISRLVDILSQFDDAIISCKFYAEYAKNRGNIDYVEPILGVDKNYGESVNSIRLIGTDVTLLTEFGRVVSAIDLTTDDLYDLYINIENVWGY